MSHEDGSNLMRLEFFFSVQIVKQIEREEQKED